MLCLGLLFTVSSYLVEWLMSFLVFQKPFGGPSGQNWFGQPGGGGGGGGESGPPRENSPGGDESFGTGGDREPWNAPPHNTTAGQGTQVIGISAR